MKPRSHCPQCGHTLGALELIPVLSYVFQGGKCRQCKAGISPLYPIMELTTGLLFLFAALMLGWTPELFVALTLISLCIIVFVSDYTYLIIPDKVLLFFLPLFVLERIFIPLSPWWDSLLGAGTGFGLLLLIAVVSKGGMGGGDIKFYGVLGIVLGFKLVLLSFFLAVFFGAFIGGIGMLMGKVKKGKAIPFGPYICFAVLIAYFFGGRILQWYFQFFI
ncbi:leader peptidase (prepilin peptidase)/N-methyltransferase [Bacillus benzoevorans]|uniref:Leader peptidase (Prepilin peptidase)/N-methyltransferase n=1 Tax=Bacillus benzoevorans TaxID=1456 RepID=A0A7X0HS46_9BACI|nr:leader peptidase (prepilin peptidase)/N-methyltransferase [Bacillus benzoevorans]